MVRRSNPTLSFRHATNSYIRVNTDDPLTITGNIINVTIDYDKDYELGYLLLAGKKGLAIGGAPGATNQGVIRRIYHATEA